MTDLVSLVGGVLAVVVVLSGAVVVWRYASRTQAARLWRDEAEAQRARADRLEMSLAELTKRVEVIEAENALLRELVTGREAATELRAIVLESHAETLRAVKRIESLVKG